MKLTFITLIPIALAPLIIFSTTFLTSLVFHHNINFCHENLLICHWKIIKKVQNQHSHQLTLSWDSERAHKNNNKNIEIILIFPISRCFFSEFLLTKEITVLMCCGLWVFVMKKLCPLKGNLISAVNLKQKQQKWNDVFEFEVSWCYIQVCQIRITHQNTNQSNLHLAGPFPCINKYLGTLATKWCVQATRTLTINSLDSSSRNERHW